MSLRIDVIIAGERITTRRLEALMQEAGVAGDEATVRDCKAVLAGDMGEPIYRLDEVLIDAAAQDANKTAAPCSCCASEVTWTDEQEASESGPWCADCGGVICQPCWDSSGHNCPHCMGV